MVTDGGMETDLIFHRGIELPQFAAFVLLETTDGRSVLSDYYRDYAEIARAAGAGLLLESPTWRANPDWGALLGYQPADLRAINSAAISFLADLREEFAVDPTVVSGMIGPRNDGYRAGAPITADESAAYHGDQIRAFADAGADLVTGYTLTDPGEAAGIVSAARQAGIAVAVSFTVEIDGALPGGLPVARAIEQVDELAPPDYYLLNCAHPSHLLPALADGGRWAARVIGVRCNASALSHDDLDGAETLHDGDPQRFAADHRDLANSLPQLMIRGGCCGTDARHVAALWGVSTPTTVRSG